MKRAIVSIATTLVVAVGCNSLLDNQPGHLDETPTGANEPNEPSSPSPSPSGTSGTSDAAAAPTADAAPPDERCQPSQSMCFGACVARIDPMFGCGQASCAACKLPHATAGCTGNTCSIGKCDPGYADCNANPADGCETDLSKVKSCGACNAVCPAANPYCAPAGATFQCTTGCTAAAPTLCGAECVDVRASLNHCGTCNHSCTAPDNGTAACTAGACTFTCKPQFHACGGACVAESDPTACGAACVRCPVPANGVATCSAGACGLTCNPGFHLCGGHCVANNDPATCGGACTACPNPANATATCNGTACGAACKPGFADCDNNPANGCEVELARDPLHCGACTTNCNGAACNNGTCAVAVDGGP